MQLYYCVTATVTGLNYYNTRDHIIATGAYEVAAGPPTPVVSLDALAMDSFLSSTFIGLIRADAGVGLLLTSSCSWQTLPIDIEIVARMRSDRVQFYHTFDGVVTNF